MLQNCRSYTIVLKTSKARNKTESTNQVTGSGHEKKYHPEKSYISTNEYCRISGNLVTGKFTDETAIHVVIKPYLNNK
jgi:hypothetical protein